MSNFDADLEVAEVIEEYLLEHLFPVIGHDVTRLESLDEQHDEGDVRATIPGVGKNLIIDVKCQGTYINNPRERFALEIGYLKQGVHKQGWLFDETKATTHYLFCWVPSAKTDWPSQPDQIERLWGLLIDRELLQRHLEVEGFDQEAAEQREETARDAGESGVIDANHSDYRYHLSGGFDERPFNIIAEYPLLEILSEETYEIDDGEITIGADLF